MDQMKHRTGVMSLTILLSLFGAPAHLRQSRHCGITRGRTGNSRLTCGPRVVVRHMTDDEKFSWISQLLPVPGSPPASPVPGAAAYYQPISRLGIPARLESDAGLGVTNRGNVRPGDDATALPSTLLLGATFDPVLAREAGAVIGREARARGFNVQLAGGANLIREPRGGRSFEYVSEDPLLTGLIAGQSVAGIQSERVVSTLKHFAVNAQEDGRVMASSNMGEAALRESDLLAFQIAMETGRPGSVMTSYNLLNGDYTSENDFLINRVLKQDWGYAGWVMSDWGGTHSTEKAALAGLDVQSGAMLDTAPYFGRPLRDAVAAGRVPQARIDDMVRRILRSLFAVGAIDAAPEPADQAGRCCRAPPRGPQGGGERHRPSQECGRPAAAGNQTPVAF